MAYDNNMRGTLSENKTKVKDTHADYSGSCTVAGLDYWVNGWVKKNTQTGEEFLSLSFKPKDVQHRRSAGKLTNTPPDFDGDPF